VLSKDEVLKDWQNTVDAGGCIILNVSARNDSYVHLQTGIKSKGGHVIAIMGVDDSGNVLFADSVFNTDSHDSGKYYEPTSITFYDIKMSLEEFYDTYGGNTSTYKGDDQRKYYTITHDELVPVELTDSETDYKKFRILEQG